MYDICNNSCKNFDESVVHKIVGLLLSTIILHIISLKNTMEQEILKYVHKCRQSSYVSSGPNIESFAGRGYPNPHSPLTSISKCCPEIFGHEPPLAYPNIFRMLPYIVGISCKVADPGCHLWHALL